MRYWIALGSNMGDRLQNLKMARQELEKLGTVRKSSPVFKSAPWGRKNQPEFLNAVLELDCSLNPYRLLRKLKAIEVQIGRQRSEHWGPRMIDLDIVQWQGPAIHSEILKIPHPYLEKRAFVLLPLASLEQNFRLSSGRSIQQVLEQLTDINYCQLLTENW